VKRLRDGGHLERVTHITSVSGGSILAAHLVLHWEDYCGDKFEERAQEILAFAQKNVRARVMFRSILCLLRRSSLTLGVQAYKTLYGKAALGSLYKERRPRLFIMGTSLNTGGLCAFSHDELRIDLRVGGDGSPGCAQSEPCSEMLIAEAVAASAAFPVLFRPLPIGKGSARVQTLENLHLITDGGVYDNLGLELFSLLDPKLRPPTIYSIDAQARLGNQFGPGLGRLLARNLRANDLLMELVTVERERTATAISPPVRIRINVRYRHDESLSEQSQATLELIRTDLDRFEPKLCGALVRHGYNVAAMKLDRGPKSAAEAGDWKQFPEFTNPNVNAEWLSKQQNVRFFQLAKTDWLVYAFALVAIIALLLISPIVYLAGLQPARLLTHAFSKTNTNVQLEGPPSTARELGPGTPIAQNAYFPVDGTVCCLVRKNDGNILLLTAATVVDGLQASIVRKMRPLMGILPWGRENPIGCIQHPPPSRAPIGGQCIGQSSGEVRLGTGLIWTANDAFPNDWVLPVTNQPFENEARIEDIDDRGWNPDRDDAVDIGVGREKFAGTVAGKEKVPACGQSNLIKVKSVELGDRLRSVAGAPVLIRGTGRLAAIVLCSEDQFLFVQPIKQVLVEHEVELVKTRKFAGACDASAIARVQDKPLAGPRKEKDFIAASDEVADDQSNKLRWFRSIDEQTVEFHLDDQELLRALETKLPPDVPAPSGKKELDIEAAATIGDTIYWIGSLGSGRSKYSYLYRQCLFSTNYKGELKLPCLDGLKEAVCRALEIPEATKCDKADIAVEGMAATPEGSLLLGLRRPLSNGRARILKLDKLSESPIQKLELFSTVDLGSKGIRAMESVQVGRLWRYFLIAGPSDRTSHENYPERGKFQLYGWNGTSDPERLQFPYGSGGGAFEGLMVDSDKHLWVSRDSDHLSDEYPCKDRERDDQKHFLLIDLGKYENLKGRASK